jgi:glycosyltransferase involved in cell wall biosynthesis
LWEQQAAKASFLKKLYLRSLAKTLKREEIAGLNTADRIWAITHEDAQRFSDLGVEKPISVIPVAMEIPELTADYSCADFFHLGSLNWEPNRKAVERLSGIWEAVHAATGTKLHIAGSFSEDFKLKAQKGLVFHGFVDDSYTFMASRGVLAAPVTTGSGVRIKLLEAMSLGVCCLTTKLGATGIDPEAKAVLLAKDDKGWITAMERIAQMEDLREIVGTRAREYIRKYHSFAAVNTQIRASLER